MESIMREANMQGNTPQEALTFGFDIGIASVGWAVLSPTRIVDLGVRCFDKAETADKGESLNLARRKARLMRRRLRRRAWRLTKLARLLKRHGLIANANFFKQQSPTTQNLWQLRVQALDRKLNAEELARVIYHLVKHRGFHWISKAEKVKAESDKQEGRVIAGLRDTERRLLEKGYRTAAEMVLNEFPEQRNKQGNYDKSLSRELLGKELADLFASQRAFGNAFASIELEDAVLERKNGLFWKQNPSLTGDKLLEMLGRCTFERTGGSDGKGEYRAPKASFTAERHVWLTRLNNLRIVVDGTARPLNETERAVVLPLPYKQAVDFKYRQLKDALVKAGHLPESARFTGLSYPSDRQQVEDKAKNPEEERLIKLPAWQMLKKTLKDKGLETEWEGMAGAAQSGDATLLDEIAHVLSVFKDGEEVEAELRKLGLPGGDRMVNALSTLSFDKFHNLSFKALRAIVPHMEAGLRYDEACVQAGYHHSDLNKDSGADKEKYLPPLYEHARGYKSGEEGKMIFSERIECEVTGGIPRNPVVLRSLNQARKVCNALIRKYGSPYAVHIEMARDLSRPMDERNKVKNAQKEFRERNDKDRSLFASTFNVVGNVKGRDFDKWQLYREQQCKCAYSLLPIDVNRLFEAGYAEIDHALPYSRSFDDSKNNKVLVLAAENRNKGNRTPYEYLDGKSNSERWHTFQVWVETNMAYRQAKRSRLLRKDFGDKEAAEFRDRNLNDTRYICRFFKNYVERYLKLADGSDNKRCVVLSGQLTAFLRKRWGFNKVREESDRHHALDAVVVAACSHSTVKRLSDYSRRKELENVRDVVDVETGEIANPALLAQLEQHFPRPWQHFYEETLLRLKCDDEAKLRTEIAALGSYPEATMQALKPLFVSRAPQRRNGGALHQMTFRSAKFIAEGKSHVRVDIKKLKLASLDKIVGAQDPRNAPLMEVLRSRLQAYNDDGSKAFSTPLYKPTADGKKAPAVRTVKLISTQNTGAFVAGFVADLGDMQSVDIYRTSKRYFVDPVYGIDKAKRVNPLTLPDDAEFLFSLTKNDYLRVTIGNEVHEGYFVMYESDGRMTLRAHDQPQPDKLYFRKGVSSAKEITKFNVDVLGNIYPAPKKERHGLA
jgi:CRISPR-associated endonuclease Csn1